MRRRVMFVINRLCFVSCRFERRGFLNFCLDLCFMMLRCDNSCLFTSLVKNVRGKLDASTSVEVYT